MDKKPKKLKKYLHDRGCYVTVIDELCPTCGGTGIVHSHNPHCWDCCYPFIGKKHIWGKTLKKFIPKNTCDTEFKDRY